MALCGLNTSGDSPGRQGSQSDLKTVAIIVSYKSATLTKQAVQSVLDAESLGSVQVVVVDNSDDKKEAEELRHVLPPGVALLLSRENIGFGRACNLAFEKFEGDQILLLNPDAKLLPSCLLRLQRTLSSSKKAGAVSSHIFWDERCRFYLPSSYPPPLLEFQTILDSFGPQAHVSRLVSAIWRYHSIKVWRSKKPVRVSNLSGGLVLLKREAVLKAGGLFDPRFFLYFEDTDLFIRLRKKGYALVIEPRAKAIHYYDQCGQEDWEWKRSLMAKSRAQLLEKHCKGLKSHIRRVMGHLRPSLTRGRDQVSQPDFTSPFSLEVPGHLESGWLFEVSPNPTFIPCAAQFGRGGHMDFPKECWDMLAPGRYFGRLGYPRPTGGCLKEMTLAVNNGHRNMARGQSRVTLKGGNGKDN